MTASVGDGLVQALRRAGVDDVLDDSMTRAAYTSDASLYRLLPQAVVRPRHTEEIAATLAVCRQRGVPLVARGAGTSVAGNAIGTGVVLDLSRHLNRVLELDPASRTAVVEPGAVHASLQARATAAGLRFGPDPSTHTRCTIGGMIGNNACGARTLAYGRTSDNVAALDLLLADGTTLTATSGDAPTVTGADSVVASLRELAGAHLAVVRTEFGRFGRQVSGYALEHLLPERGFDLARAMVGSEGTLALVTGATVRLVVDPPHRVLVVLGFPDIAAAGDAAPAVLAHHPTACEGLDRRIVDVVRTRRGAASVPTLAAGAAWLLVEVVGESSGAVKDAAVQLIAAVDAIDARIVEHAGEAGALWRVREDGAGLAGRAPSGRPAYSGWEDSAVPVESLGGYLRDFDALLDQHGLTGLPYGHFGDGCLHVRLDFDLDGRDGPTVLDAFLADAATLVTRYGGSLSGEHGDGRARSELLSAMYSPAALAVQAAVKHLLDPGSLLNPGVLVDPDPAAAHLRVPAAPPLRRGLALAYVQDGGDVGQAVHRCTGVGKCRADTTASGGVMCPSYLATREEKDSTRARARVLQEMVAGNLSGWRAPEVHDVLDLCLSCKGCASDCPTGIDMASYKAEVLHQTYRHRRRPASHYALGWLPRWARLASAAPGLANAGVGLPGSSLLLRAAGVDARRSLPRFASRTFRSWFADHTVPQGKPVVIFVDTFTNHFSPEVGIAAVRVLESAGWAPQLTSKQVCCGLTWITTGQLDAARRILRRTVGALAPAVSQGISVVGLEPSCTGVLRSDARELLPTAASAEVAAATHTLTELLTSDASWRPPSLAGEQVVAQPHCHHHAVMGWSADADLLASAGADVQRLGGCCGLAGNFGVERGHYDVSVAVAEHQLLPAVRSAPASATILADGFSCRTQLDDLADRSGEHLAQLLARHLPDGAA